MAPTCFFSGARVGRVFLARLLQEQVSDVDLLLEAENKVGQLNATELELFSIPK